MYGVESTIAMPSATNSWRASHSSRRLTGSTPLVGSSSSSTFGLVEERAGERELLVHAAGERVGAAVEERGRAA